MKSEKALGIGHEFICPKEEMLELDCKKDNFSIGIPNENNRSENRVCLTPLSVQLLVDSGHKVLIETGAGNQSNYSDQQYSENGACIVQTKAETFQADMIIQISPLSSSDIKLLREKQIVFSSLDLHNLKQEDLKQMLNKKITAIALNLFKDDEDFRPIVRSMSEIAGISSVIIASEYLSKARDGKGVMLGGITGITPPEIVILGAGTAAEYATRTALGLGVMVKIFDNSINRLRKLEDKLGQRVFTSIYHPLVIEKALLSADVVIGSMNYDDRSNRFYVSEQMIQNMKPGSIIIDLNMEHGGCFESSKPTNTSKPSFIKHKIIHYCVPNIPSYFSRTSSLALSNIISPLLIEIGDKGGIFKQIANKKGIREGAYIYRGVLTNEKIASKFNILCKDINLLIL
ncbi:MAG: alanine dehydrogenase [Marinifilaceae bacterium]|nr:alanine dehydrogenase [Marinifilaceae bacterium]